MNINYLESFSDYLFEEEKAVGTIDGYTLDVRDFLTFVGKDIQQVKRTDMNDYKEHLRARKLRTLTINRKMVSIKQFIDFLNERFELGVSVRITQEKIQRQYSLNDEDLLTEEDYTQLLDAVIADNNLREKAIFEAMYYSGMRVSEALQLRLDHVQNGIKVIEDIKGKGGKYRPIFISEKLIQSLKEYMAIRSQPFSSTTKLLFVGERGPITRQTVHNKMKEYARLSGVEETKVHAHNLRHLFGLRLAARGVPIEDIAKFMGHTSIEVTKIYLEKPQSHYANLIDQL
ncbi:tyrosine-type recombinase/integrase [Pseudogracilibacillus auburnensis]|uniref:tyrosine-type recombinase/integrase n=1 Tax=Pseudogracilibacillus auburnensis TaxID=1494959 RepID=UPI001A96E9E2|nr:tyrosine-type recombinase/integrase [Pseudogracilibacillus auburnensis]MBO1005769.1 tyrosine-type recombinase/integrase [Pseudogracilibacillus auburnensis]